jgi:hypothetical protein
MRRAALALPALLALLACQGPAPSGRPPPPPPAASAALSVHDGSGAAGPFKLADLERLAVDVRYAGGEPGPHSLRLDVVSPRGTLYAQLRGTLAVGADGSASASQALEVRGTPIDGFQQVGGWRFVLAVDEGEPLASAEVSLTP